MVANLNSGTLITMISPSEVAFAKVRDAVQAAGFDLKYAREMAKRDAFSRAARELSKQRIIRKVEESETEIQFQFTREFLADHQYRYEKECEMYLDKHTGVVRSDCAELGAEAQRLLDDHLAKRNASDITRMVQRIFDDRKGDLVSIRPNGGVYFVPDTHRSLVDSVDVLLEKVGGTLIRYTIHVNEDASTSRTVAQNLNDHLHSLIGEFRRSCENLNPETSDAVIDRRVSAIAELRDKLRSYQALLSGHADSIEEEIDRAESDLLAVVFGTATTTAA